MESLKERATENTTQIEVKPSQSRNSGKNEKPQFVKNYYDEERQTFKEFLEESRRYIILIPLCILLMFILCVIFIGNGAYMYNEQTYRDIEGYMEEFLESGTSITNIEALEEKVDNVSYKNKEWTCNIKRGFFNAEVTADLSGGSLKFTRNFSSRNAYMVFYWFVFGGTSIIGGTAFWFILNGLFYFVPFLMVKVYELWQKFCELWQKNKRDKQLNKATRKAST
ncbi:MAG: hypothetical protein K2H53_06460 [Clostridia bacterium]|nr:hypothetical protein [Clostridia bacterium]